MLPLIDFDGLHFFLNRVRIFKRVRIFSKSQVKHFESFTGKKKIKKNLICICPKPGPGLQNLAPPQKIIGNILLLFHHRFLHPKFTPENRSEGVQRVKKNKLRVILLRI